MWFLFLVRLYMVSFPCEVVYGFFSFMMLYVVSFPYEVVCGLISL